MKEQKKINFQNLVSFGRKALLGAALVMTVASCCDVNKEAKLEDAIKKGRDNRAERWVRRGAEPASSTALQIAIEQKNDELIDFLLPKSSGSQVENAISDAQNKGDKDMLKLLVEDCEKHQIKINSNGFICSAVDKNQEWLVDFWLEHGADKNAALKHAIDAKKIPIPMMDHLIDKGADAVKALKETVYYRDLATVDHLLNRGVSIKSLEDKDGKIDIGGDHFYLTYLTFDMLKLLKKHGGTFKNLEYKFNFNAFGGVCDNAGNANIEFANWLLENGADLNKSLRELFDPYEFYEDGDDLSSENPYPHEVARVALAKLLISRGADINSIKDKNGKVKIEDTDLIGATERGRYSFYKYNLETIKYLHSLGCSFGADTERYGTLYDVYNYHGNSANVLFAPLVYLEIDDNPNEYNKETIKIANWLHQQGYNADGKLLFIANSCENMEALVKCGADINARDKLGRTPFMDAAKHQWISGLKWLHNAGADIFACDKNGKNARDYACWGDKTAYNMIKTWMAQDRQKAIKTQIIKSKNQRHR